MVAAVKNGVEIIGAVSLRMESVSSISGKALEVSVDRTYGTDRQASSALVPVVGSQYLHGRCFIK